MVAPIWEWKTLSVRKLGMKQQTIAEILITLQTNNVSIEEGLKHLVKYAVPASAIGIFSQHCANSSEDFSFWRGERGTGKKSRSHKVASPVK